MTVLHAGGKFDGKAYETSGGPARRRVSVVNALSDDLEVEVARNRRLYRQRVLPRHRAGRLEDRVTYTTGAATRVRSPRPQIFGTHARFERRVLFRMARPRPISSAASKSAGPAIGAPAGRFGKSRTGPFSFPAASRTIWPPRWQEFTVTANFAGKSEKSGGTVRSNGGHLVWRRPADPFLLQHHPDTEGERTRRPAHCAEKGLRTTPSSPRTSALRSHHGRCHDLPRQACSRSSFREPKFVVDEGQAGNGGGAAIVDNALRDPFGPYPADNPAEAAKLSTGVERAEERVRRRKERKSAARRRSASCAAGQLADCAKYGGR